MATMHLFDRNRPMSPNAPTRLTPRHHHMAYMLATGKTQREVAQAIGANESWVSVVASSPLFQETVRHIMRDIQDKTTTDVAGKITRLGERAARRLEDLMEQDDNASVALNATTYILDRNPQVAALKQQASEGGVVIRLDAEVMHRMDTAIAEAEGRVVAAVATPVPGELRVRTLDEAIASLARDDDTG